MRNITFKTTTLRLGIVGRNGSGKSTLARVIAGLLKPTAGSAEVNGNDLAKNRKAAIQEVGFLFQNPDHQIIFPTVLEEVAFGLRQLGQRKSDAERNALATLSSFSKSHWADEQIFTLSQGQRHLVCLMSVLAMQPKIIILDEPFSGLDIPTKMQLNAYLESYQGGLIHVSHDSADLRDYERILWLENGIIQGEGPPDRLLPSYVAEMTRLGETDDISNLAD